MSNGVQQASFLLPSSEGIAWWLLMLLRWRYYFEFLFSVQLHHFLSACEKQALFKASICPIKTSQHAQKVLKWHWWTQLKALFHQEIQLTGNFSPEIEP